jgi:hypothetical protein
MAYLLSVVLFDRFPEVFLPLYESLEDQYHDLETYRSLWKLVRDNRESMVQLGLYLGFLLFEILRRDWKNTVLILTVGILNGLGWSLLQAWTWAPKVWPGAQFNFWRCWETSGGVSIGIAYGIAYYLVNRQTALAETGAQLSQEHRPPGLGWLVGFISATAILGYLAPEVMPRWCAGGLMIVAALFAVAYYVRARVATRHGDSESSAVWSAYGPKLERWGAYAGLIFGLGISIQRGLKGWANIYLGDERYWNTTFMYVVGPAMIVALATVSACAVFCRYERRPGEDPFPRAYAIAWLVLGVQNILAQLITGPTSSWYEVAFNIYYVLLFLISAVVIFHYHVEKSRWARDQAGQ